MKSQKGKTMKKKIFEKTMAVILSVCMLATSASWDQLLVKAADEIAETEQSIEPDQVTAENEITEKRTTDSTVFDLGGNRKMEVFYGGDVRFEKDGGELVDYDPALVPVASEESINGESLDGYAYENREGDSKQYLPEILSETTPIKMEKEGYSISFYPIQESTGLESQADAGNVTPLGKEMPIAEEVSDQDSLNESMPIDGEPEADNSGSGGEVQGLSAEKEADALRPVSIEDMESVDLYGEESNQPLKAVYENEAQTYQLEYESSDIGVKESIVLNEILENNRFSFEFHLQGMDIRENPTDEGFTFYDKVTGDMVGGIEAPFMNDVTGEAYSEDIVCELEEKEGVDDTYILTVIPSENYLRDENRAYPVTIDPTVTWTGTSQIRDVYVCGGSPATNYYSSGVKTISVGRSSKQGLYRTYIKFIDIRTKLAGKYVESATLDLYESGGGVAGEYVRAYRTKDSWEAASINWNNKPSYNTGSYYDQFKTTGKAGTKRTLNITENARQMARNDFPGHGVMLRAATEGTGGFYTQFYNSRYATASQRPKLTVVYYDAPTKPDKVQTNANYYKKGSTVQVTWSGISSRALDHVEYRLVKMNDATGTEAGVVIDYSSSTKIGTAASGTASIGGSNTWGEGCYRLWVRGVDKGGIAGAARSWNFHIDSTAPVIGSVSLDHTGYTAIRNPILSWSSVSDVHLKEIQYQVGSGAYTAAGSGAAGRVEIPASNFPSSGVYTIHVRAVDYAGNISAVKSLTYQVDITPPTFGTVTTQPAEGQWTENGNPIIYFSNITELHSGMEASGVTYNITPQGEKPQTYKNAANLRFTSASSPYAGNFTMDSTDQNKPDGAYTIHIRLKDRTDNAVIKEVSYKRDRTAPTGTLTYSQDKTALHDTVQITAACSDGTGSGIKTSSLILQDTSGNKVDTVYSNVTTASVTKPFNTLNIKNGTYTLVLTVEDNANHKTTKSETVKIQNQLPAPTLTGSNRNDRTAQIQWSLPSSINTLKAMEIQMNGSSTWNRIPNSGKMQGYYTVTLPAQEGAYDIKVRAVDTTDFAGREATVKCIYDRTKPMVLLTSLQQGAMRGTAMDAYLKIWTLQMKEQGQEDSAYKRVGFGTSSIENGVLQTIDIGSRDYEVGKTYQFLLSVEDVAGNSQTAQYSYTKKEGDNTWTIVDPVYVLEQPAYLRTGESEYSIPQNTNYLELKANNGTTPRTVEWYIDNQKISGTNQQPGSPWILNFGNLKGSYPDGTKHTIIARCTDAAGKVTYSVPSYQNAYNRELNLTSNNAKTLEFEEPLSGFTLVRDVRPGSSNVRSFYVKDGGSNWIEIEAGREYQISELFANKLTVSSLAVKYQDKVPPVDTEALRLVGNTVEPESFRVSEMDNYVPISVTAVSKLNYKTYLTWDRNKTDKTEVKIPDDVSYEIYRACSRDELLNMEKATVTGIKDDYYSELNINYGEDFYYRVRAVRKKKNVQTGKDETVYSSFSNVISTKVVDGDEYTKLLGYKSYWEYESFENPVGTGYVEKSQGNFVYTQTDAEIENEKLPVKIDRTYNSQASTVSSLGLGWNHSYDIELLNINEADKLIDRKALRDETGTIFLFEKLQDGTYASSMGRYITLKAEEKKETVEIPAKNGNSKISKEIVSSYTMLTKDNLEYRFNSGGQLIYVKEPNGSFLLLTHDGKTGRLLTAVTNQNLMVTFTYEIDAKEKADKIVEQAIEDLEQNGKTSKGPMPVENKVVDMTQVANNNVTNTGVSVEDAVNNLLLVRKISLPDGSDLQYEYDEQNHLNKVVRSDGKTNGESVSYLYEYNGQGNLSVIKDANEIPYTVVYQGKKVSELLYPITGGQKESVRFAYEDLNSGDYVSSTVIQKGLNGVYGKGEMVKCNRFGNILYRKDILGLESFYTYEDNLPKTKTFQVYYQELVDGKVITKSKTKTEEIVYDPDQNMNPVMEHKENGGEVTYEYANQINEYVDDLPTRTTEGYDDEIYDDEYYDYDEYGNLIYEEDLISGDISETFYYDEDSEFPGEEKETVDKIKVIGEDNTEAYLTTTTKYEYAYDKDGIKTETTTVTIDGKSTVSVERYDTMGRLIYTDDGSGNTVTYTYDFMGREVLAEYNENGKRSSVSYIYDKNGTLVQETSQDGTKFIYSYDTRNRIVQKKQIKDTNQLIWKTSYDYEWSQGTEKELLSVLENVSPGGSTEKTYTSAGGLSVKAIKGGLMTWSEFDPEGKVIAQHICSEDGSEEGTVTVSLYDENGNVTACILNPGVDAATGAWMISDDSVVTSSTYDVMNHQTSKKDGEGNVVTYVYENLKALKEVRINDGTGNDNVTTFENDVLEPDGTTSSKTTDANGNVSKEYFDTSGNKIKTSDLGDGSITPITTFYVYDNNDNVIRETYADGNYKEFQYDERSRLKQEGCFDKNGSQSLETKYTYTETDQILVIEDFKISGGQKKRYHYTNYTYDENDQLTGVAEYNGEDIPSEAQLAGGRIAYSYDLDGRLTEIIYPPNRRKGLKGLKYVYNEYGWKTEILAVQENGQEEILNNFSYTGIGNLDTEIVNIGLFDTGSNKIVYKKYTYDVFSRISKIAYYDSPELTNCLESYEYTYDKNSHILTESKYCNTKGMTEGEKVDEIVRYDYDPLGRIIKVTINNKKTGKTSVNTYSYDKVGNRISEKKDNIETVMTYNSLNQIVTAEQKKGTTPESKCTYHYDKRGNLVLELDDLNNLRTESVYDIKNQLESQKIYKDNKLSVTQENKYNGEGQRTETKVNGSVTHYYYQGATVFLTADEKDDTVDLYLLNGENNVIAAKRCKDQLNGEYFFYNKDVRNSTTAILNSTGTIAQSYQYGTFGETEVYGSEIFTDFCYTGGIYDSATGLYYLNARYYDPEDGRFITRDTYRGEKKEPSSLHLYSYCANDPVNFLDLSGHNKKFIKDQGYGVMVDGKRMEDIPVGAFGNVADNGCAAIATYNLMIFHGYKPTFKTVLDSLVIMRGGNKAERAWNAVGIGGILPFTVKRYLKNYFEDVKSKFWWGWENIVKRSRGIITLFQWPGKGKRMHYVAGITKASGKKIKFYSSFLDDYKNNFISISEYMRLLKKEGCKRKYIISIGKRKKERDCLH